MTNELQEPETNWKCFLNFHTTAKKSYKTKTNNQHNH